MLNKPAGVWYEEFSNLAAPLELDAAAPLTLTPAAHATRWADGLLADGADVLARYRHREFGRFAAITTRSTATDASPSSVPYPTPPWAPS